MIDDTVDASGWQKVDFKMNKRELISRSSIFSSLSTHALDDLASIANASRMVEEEILFSEGEDATKLFILADGCVELVKLTQDGRERFVRRVGEGETFAEAAMFAGESYPVTAVARTPGELVVIEKGAFSAYLERHPEASMAMLGAMAKLLRHWSGLLSELSLASVEARIAAWLLKRARKTGRNAFELGIQKKELAFRLGTVPETLSRNLKKLSDSGAISMRGDEITIEDADILGDLVAR